MTGSYTFGYYLAWVVAIIGVVAGVLAGVGYTGLRPSWETADVSATAAIVSAICVGLSALLPQVGRTPQAREDTYLRAVTGVLPDDLAQKYPALIPGAPPVNPPNP